MSPALMAGVAGLIALPREFSIPCVMSLSFTDGIRTARGETIPAAGITVRLDISGEKGQVHVVEDRS